MTGDVIDLHVETDELVADVKRRLHAQNPDFTVNLQRLAVMLEDGGYAILADDRSIGSYCAASGATVELLVSDGFRGGEFVRLISESAESPALSRMTDPWGVCLSPDGETLFVSSISNHCILVLSASDGSHIRSIGSEGADDGQLKHPAGICLSNSGKLIFVADDGNHRVQAFRVSDGSHIFTIGRRGFGSGQFFNFPTAIRMSPDGELLLVCDTHNHRIQVISGSDGSVRTIGSRGSGSGQLEVPTDVCVSPDGEYCFVADTKNHRVQVFRVGDGAYTRSIGSHGSGAGQFRFPLGVCLSPCGELLFVSDQPEGANADDRDDRVQVFRASDGEFMHTIGHGMGSNAGRFGAASMCLSPGGKFLFIVDRKNDRVQVFTA